MKPTRNGEADRGNKSRGLKWVKQSENKTARKWEKGVEAFGRETALTPATGICITKGTVLKDIANCRRHKCWRSPKGSTNLRASDEGEGPGAALSAVPAIRNLPRIFTQKGSMR